MKQQYLGSVVEHTTEIELNGRNKKANLNGSKWHESVEHVVKKTRK